LQIHHQLRKNVHSLDKLANFASSALLDFQVVANLPGSRDEVLAVVSGELKKIISGELVPTFLGVSQWFCMRSWR
jgi:hypothetical protein